MNIDTKRFVEIAQRWQGFHCRTSKEAMAKMVEEMREYWDADSYVEELDEIGDVLVLAMRVMVTLSPAELEAVYEIAKMKADRRIDNPKKKIKSEEYKLRDEIIKRHGLTGV